MLHLVAEFLTLDELFNVSNSSKVVHKYVQIQSVVFVGMINGNTHTKTFLENIFDSTSVGSIYTPSSNRVSVVALCQTLREL